VCADGDSAGLGRAGGSGGGWHLCSGCAKRVADGLPFYVRRWMVWMASRMLMIMNRYNQTGGSNAMRSGWVAVADVGMIVAMRGRRGSREEVRGWGVVGGMFEVI
jgi:hypothetical protein